MARRMNETHAHARTHARTHAHRQTHTDTHTHVRVEERLKKLWVRAGVCLRDMAILRSDTVIRIIT